MSELSEIMAAKNHHYEIKFLDFTLQWDYIQANKPEKTKGQKYQAWVKNVESYNKHYAKTPYWINVVFWGDDDMIMQKEFSNYGDCFAMFNDLATCPDLPDFNKLGFF